MAEVITATIAPALQAIREVLDDGSGAARTIDSTRFDTGVWDSLNTSEKSRRALVKPRFEVEVESTATHPASPSQPCNILISEVMFKVMVVRHMELEHTADLTRETIRGLATNDGFLLALALSWPGNLTQDSDSNATGLVSGCLKHERSAVTRFELNTDAASVIETTHTFAGVHKATVVTS